MSAEIEEGFPAEQAAKRRRGEPGPAILAARLAQVAGVFFGVALTAWTFLYLFGLSMQHNHIEKLAALFPAAGLAGFLFGWKRDSPPALRWAWLEFFASSLATYLLLQFVIIDMI